MKKNFRSLIAYEIGGAFFFLFIFGFLRMSGVAYALKFSLYPFFIFQLFLIISYLIDWYVQRRN